MPRLSAAVTAFWAAMQASATASKRSPGPALRGDSTPGGAVGTNPPAAVRQKHQAEFRLGNEGLVVAQIRQPRLLGGVGDVQNRVELLVARRGRLEGCFQNGGPLPGGHRLVGEDPNTFAGVQRPENFIIHDFTLLCGAGICPAASAPDCRLPAR